MLNTLTSYVSFVTPLMNSAPVKFLAQVSDKYQYFNDFKSRGSVVKKAGEELYEFWQDPNNKSTFQKMEAVGNSVFLIFQGAEAGLMIGIVKCDPSTKAKISIISSALSIALILKNSKVFNIENGSNLEYATEFLQIACKTSSSFQVVFHINPGYFNESKAIFNTIDNVLSTALRVRSTIGDDLSSHILNNVTQVLFYLPTSHLIPGMSGVAGLFCKFFNDYIC